MKKLIAALLLSATVAGLLLSCTGADAPAETAVTTAKVTQPLPPETQPPAPVEPGRYEFDTTITEDVLCHYLARAVTIASRNIDEWDGQNGDHIKKYILNTGAKYIARANDAWAFSKVDDDKWNIQKTFIDEMHGEDPDLVFEACIFENVVKYGVEEIAIPAYVFEAFGKEPEARNFRYADMLFKNKRYVDHWYADSSVPDITREETQMFFYSRATRYIDAGFEALHLGQVNLMGEGDKNWKCFTKIASMIRAYATEHARRHFVFLNAHSHGIIGTDGILLFDFHMYPSRPMPVTGSKPHPPSEEAPQEACFKMGHSDSIYGDSLGGKTYSGWECKSLPYLVELDNYGGVNNAEFNMPYRNSMWIWGMDEISWFGSQPAWYREQFLRYAVDWIAEQSGGKGFFAMPAQREARIYNENAECTALMYYGYNQEFFGVANDDEWIVKRIWEDMEKSGR